jgi:hypothetical protein
MNLSFNVLNQAMLTQVLHELRLGNLQRCKALGLGEDDIYLLQSLPPTTLSRLAHATVPWVEVKIDSPVLHRLIEQAERDEQNERLINRALKLGASSTIMYQCFGLAHSETALRRRLLKIETRKGRPQHLSEAQEHALAALVPTTRSGRCRGSARRHDDAGRGATDQLDHRLAADRPVQQRNMNTALPVAGSVFCSSAPSS